MTKHKSIAVDGPSGAGKSTLAKLLARRLGFLYVLQMNYFILPLIYNKQTFVSSHP